MVGLIKLHVDRGGTTDVLHVTREELKAVRKRLAAGGWVIYHSEIV